MILPEELTSQLESFNLCMYVCMHICIYVCVCITVVEEDPKALHVWQVLICILSPRVVLRQDFTMRPWLNLNS